MPGRRGRPGINEKLENVFQGKLYKPRIACLTHLSIGRTVVAITGVATRIQELGVVKGVEEFYAELQVRSLRDRCVLVESQRPILNSRSTANGSWGVAELTRLHGGIGKSVGIKVKAGVLSWVQVMKRHDLIRFARVFEGEDIAEQFAI